MQRIQANLAAITNGGRSITVAWIIVVVTFAACEGNGNDIRDTISGHLGPTQDHLKFNLVLPSYLPAGTDQKPFAIIEGEGSEITIAFSPNGSAMAPLHESPRVEIRESSPPKATPGTILDLDGTVIEQANPKLEKTVIRGTEVIIDRQRESGGVVFIAMYARFKDVGAVVTLDWTNPSENDGIRLTEDMELEAFKVFESMLDDDSADETLAPNS
jgi:hypothetical protein